jgi:hypothetical protein
MAGNHGEAIPVCKANWQQFGSTGANNTFLLVVNPAE